MRSFLVLLLIGCSAGRGTNRDGGADASAAPENTSAACQNGIDDDLDGLDDCVDPDCADFVFCESFDAGARPDGFVECGEISGEAQNLFAPVDIIWVVDSSDSMENDASTVQNNLDEFAADIEARGIDFHVVLISDQGFVTPSPLFATDPRFLFVNRSVGSNDAFDRVLDQFPNYMAHLRPGAITHVVGVTDDDENTSQSTFITMMNGLLGHDFTYHVIGSPPGECNSTCPFGCSTCFDGAAGCERPGDWQPAANPSEEHWDAAAATGGLTFSICTSDWSGLFDTLAMTVAVSEELPCTFALPEPPAGMEFDPNLVNVDHYPSASSSAHTRFPNVASAAACSGTTWYYDADPPTQILLCPDACTTAMAGGRIEIAFGCVTVPF